MKRICLLKGWQSAAAVLAPALTLLGCYNTQPDYSPLTQGPAPRRMPSPAREA
jgi:hypothetical protein